MRNSLPEDPPQDGFYIINLDNESGNGTHWSGLWCDNTGAVYFDSFGAPAPLEVEAFIRSRYGHKKYGYNNWIVQSLDSNACGYYVLFFGRAMMTGGGGGSARANRYVNNFVDNTEENEKILRSFVTEYL